MKCENCGDKCKRPAMAPIWKEYRVGSVDSPDRFHLCPSCKKTVDPIEQWADQATETEVQLNA